MHSLPACSHCHPARPAPRRQVFDKLVPPRAAPAPASRLAVVAGAPVSLAVLLVLEAVVLASPATTLAAGGVVWNSACAAAAAVRGLLV